MLGIWTHVRLLVDIASIRLLVWLLGRDGELLDSHLFFYDRYSQLSDYHRVKGHLAKANRLAALAEVHFDTAPDDDPPLKTAAMAMPVPRPPINTSAVSTLRLPNPRPTRRSGFEALPAR
jgi:hypothetical protein